ncbi:gamma-glutamylcyclotransferase family protein [Halomonas cupida]|uniref:Uncharacterized conserved protein YtfP, gamma-glutamylcyclotransferase (GGCT)/AIG2-like family n=2 Tax=Halomonas cupida TaxID=44933 RepID=A0A1M7JMX0_9GAMM|nr:gamma-glutamylcyclotransferase family protein [Halomonas cupida]SHM54420.1 Uncharacterized conserved protein YtfP, gamma-glutamylcyclotransferase (GGCT)/AIG2-like family [Halomonas cupida]
MTTRYRMLTRISLIVLLLLCLTVGGAWLVWRSPLGYDPPADLPEVGAGPHQVFVYGTLRSPVVRWLVTTDYLESTPAVLEDYRRDGLDVDTAPGHQVEGELLSVDRETLLELDRYERLGVRYRRVPVKLQDGQQVWLYQRLSDQD